MDYRHDKDYYAALGVDPSSPADEIARAYRQLARQHHPDLHPHDPDAEERFKEINEAYTVLSDPEKHAQYDLQRAGSRSSWSPVPSPGPSQDEQPAGPLRYEFARQVDIQWAGEDLEALLQQAANSFAGELRDALREFGEELDSVSRTMRAHVPDRRGRQGFPPPSPPSGRPPGGGRPPGNGRPPQGGKAPKP